MSAPARFLDLSDKREALDIIEHAIEERPEKAANEAFSRPFV